MEIDDPFVDIVPKNHPYFDLLNGCLPKLKSIFTLSPNDHLSTLQSAFPLKIYCRENPDAKYATFIYFFTFPVSPSQYLCILKNYQTQKKLDTYMEQFKIYKDLEVANTELLYLSYKKVLIVMPRYFIYVRYTFEINGEIWIIAISDPEAESQKNKTKAEIVLSVTRLKPIEGGTEISIFSQTDMKMNLKFQTAKQRGFIQIKKYVQKIYQLVKK